MKSSVAALLCSLLTIAANAQTGHVGIGTTSPQSQLHTTRGVRHDTLVGNGNRLVYADPQGRIFTISTDAPTAAPHAPIPTNGCASGNGVVSTIVVTGQPVSVSSAAIRVRVDITHTWDADVRAYLTAPTGQVLRLIYDNGFNGSNFTNTVFWDSAASALPIASSAGAPFTGRYKPTGGSAGNCSGIAPPIVNTFSAFGSGGMINPNGLWTLRVYDKVTSDNGTLNDWSISFNGSDPPATFTTFTPNAMAKGNGDRVLESCTSLFEVDNNIGIGTATPHAPLQFSNNLDQRKIVLYEVADDDHQFLGIGINPSILRYQVAASVNDHVFFSGDGPAASSELMRIKGNGNVGIGAAPLHRLHASSAANSTAYFSTTSTDPNGVVIVDIPAANASCNTCSEFVSFQKAGTSIGNVSANLSANTVSYNTTSDKRLKEDITLTRYGLQDLLRIEVKDYRMKGATNRTTGVMAQDLFRIYPEAVQEGDSGEEVQNAWAVDYGKLTPLLIKAVQEQQQEIERLRAAVQHLSTENAALKTSTTTIAELTTRLERLENSAATTAAAR